MVKRCGNPLVIRGMKTLKRGEFLAPYWLNSVTKYRPFHLDYDQDPEQNFNTWKDTEFLGQSDTLLELPYGRPRNERNRTV